ncbi:MAG: response regulator [Candidatus Omnitrophica bacterium]|nr:response regulator [Candidatus Omnitrophota bacterium]
MTKILVVDDEIDVCDFVRSFFEERNFQVFTALNGSEGLRIFKREKPHIVLLDVRMKEMDGIETLRKMKGVNKKAKVIMVTAIEDQDKMDTARKIGALEYITKPLVLENLESIVMSYAKEGKNA